MRIHCLQHVSFEGLGFIQNWINTNRYELTYTRFFEDYVLPSLDDFDFLIVLGGPMGVYEQDKYSWLSVEKEFIKQAVQANKKVLGICLGAQLIAASLGAKVYPNKQKEIGWFPVKKAEDSNNSNLFFESIQAEFTVFHWHGDTFDLPTGAKLIASSEACTNQAFVYNERVIGLQFHLEMTEETIRTIILNCGEELVDERFIQTQIQILNSSFFIKDNNIKMNLILDYLKSC